MMIIIFAGLVWLMCGQPGIIPLTLAQQNGVWDKIPDDIFVLEHTTARFNWTHTIRGNVHIKWDYIRKDGNKEEVLAYARGHVDNFTLNYRRERADYDIFPGSAILTLKNVTAYDQGTYEVSIASSAARSTDDISRVELTVIPAYNVTLRVVIDGEVFMLSVAENGTDITLPEGHVVFLTNPSITVEVGEFVPTPLSIVTKYDVKESPIHEALEPKEFHGCELCRKLSFSWFNDIYIRVAFNIQNANNIHIRKKIRNQVPWKSIPGNITVLANTTASFKWSHDIPGPVVIYWYHWKNDPHTFEKIMSHSDGVTSIQPGPMSLRIRYVGEDRSAAIKLEKVAWSDEGFYEVVVVDKDATSPHNLSNVAKLTVLEESALGYIIWIDDISYHLSVVDNGSDVRLPVMVAFLPANHTIRIKTTKRSLVADVIIVTDNDEENKTCRHTHNCVRSFEFNSRLATDEARHISIDMNFGIQNLKSISVQYTLHLNSSYEQMNRMGDDTVNAGSNIQLIVAGVVPSVVCVVLVVLLFIVYQKYKDVQNNNEGRKVKYKPAAKDDGASASLDTPGVAGGDRKRTTSRGSTNDAIDME